MANKYIGIILAVTVYTFLSSAIYYLGLPQLSSSLISGTFVIILLIIRKIYLNKFL